MALFDPFFERIDGIPPLLSRHVNTLHREFLVLRANCLTSALLDQQRTLARHLDNIYAFKQDWQALEMRYLQIRALFNEVKTSWPPNKVTEIQNRFNKLFGRSFLSKKMVTLQLTLLEKTIKNVQIAKCCVLK